MSLFDDAASGGAFDAERTSPRRPRSGRDRAGLAAVVVAVVLGAIFALLPSPYVIEQPGPVFDTLGTAERDGEDIPLISIPDEETFPTDGSLDLLTVSIVGRPGATPNWLEVLAAWFDRARSAVPVEQIFPPGLSTEDRDAQNQAAMIDSQQDAIAAALVELGYDFPREVTVASLLEDSPADGVLQSGDVITAVDGEGVGAVDELREAVREHGAGTPATVTVVRDGETLEAEVTPVDRDGVPVIGVGVSMRYEFPIDVAIQLDDVGGPSAGMMFALGIVDKLTPDALTGGERIAGTGTIDSSGNVGPIGGIRQKLWGADGAGADWFLAPESNCAEVVGHVPDGLTVFAVSDLDEARDIVETVGEGGDVSGFAGCDAS